MRGLNICYGCMQWLESENSVCRNCGYDNANRQNLWPNLPEGTILSGKYFVGRLLERSDADVIYIGRDLDLDIRVAIREYFPNHFCSRMTEDCSVVSRGRKYFNGDPFLEGRKIFFEEARKLPQISGPNFDRIRDFICENGTVYAVMDYVDGRNLEREIKDRGKMSCDRVLKLMEPLIMQLEKIHRQGMFYQNIEPKNIILVEQNGEEKLVLCNMGATTECYIEGALDDYMDYSPSMERRCFEPWEKFDSRRTLGAYTAVYALCATVYYLLTGTVPPSSCSRTTHGGVRLIKPSELGVELPEYVETAVLKGTEYRIEDRYQSMTELYDALYRAGPDPGKNTEPYDPLHHTDPDSGKNAVKRLFQKVFNRK